MSRSKDLTGKRFGKLVVLKKTNKRYDKRVVWKCICDCGNEKFANTSVLKNGSVKSCGCLFKYKKGKAAFNALYRDYKKQAKNRGFEFNIPEEDFRRLTSENCFYCDAEPTQEFKRVGANGSYFYNGVDRLDNEKGYVKGNCVACCKVCNYAKRSMSYSQFKGWIRKVYSELCIDSATKTPGELIDALITTDIKCYMFQEKQLGTDNLEEKGKYGQIVLELNKKRNLLMRKLDFVLGFEDETVTPKTYHEDMKDLEAEF